MEDQNKVEIVEAAPAAESSHTQIVKKTVKKGVTFGSALAMVISYTNWHSVGWAILHGLMSRVYVVYYVLRY